MNRYEALLILNVKGGDDAVKETVERLEGEFKKEGAAIESIQKMDRRHFTYVAQKVDAGYFVNFIFQAEAPVIEKLRAKFKLDAEIFRQNYTKLAAKKAAVAA